MTPSLAILLVTALPVAAAAQDLRELGPVRPPMVHETAMHQEGILRVKFREGLRIRLRDGAPRHLDTGARALDPQAFDGTWRRTHAVPEARLEQLRDTARARLGDRVADHNLEFDYILGGQQDPNVLIQRFHADPLIEYARPAGLPVATPLVDDFEPLQGYLDPATDGVGAEAVRHLAGGTGATMRVADIEYAWDLDHQDLPAVGVLGETPVHPKPEKGNHRGAGGARGGRQRLGGHGHRARCVGLRRGSQHVLRLQPRQRPHDRDRLAPAGSTPHLQEPGELERTT